jgi:hypothetical protein
MTQLQWLFIFFLLPTNLLAKKTVDKVDPTPIAKLKRDIEYLASDALEGRMAGSKGESLAADYIEMRFKELNLQPYKGQYQHGFSIKEGRKVGNKAFFKINNTSLIIGKDIIPMPYSGGEEIHGLAMPNVDETDNVWLIPLSKTTTEGGHVTFKQLYEKSKEYTTRGANAIVFFNDMDAAKDLDLKLHPTFEILSVPVVFVRYQSFVTAIKPTMKKDWLDINARLGYEDATLNAKNVIAILDNKAPLTVLITADYDHMGINGEIFNGANNNASGVASLLALAEQIKTASLRQYNYVFAALSGSKFNHQGAVHFLKETNKTKHEFNFLIDLNMLGRYNKINKHLYVSGVGTSTVWPMLLQRHNKEYILKVDSAGFGFGGYSHFYKKDIPLVSFSTGYMSDYAKPTDDTYKINYASMVDINLYMLKIIIDLDRMPRISFYETTNIAEKLDALKNNIGIIPDMSFDEDGVRVANCLLNRQAEKAGIESEDIIIRIGEFRIDDIDDYVRVMNKLDKGREIPVTVKRGKNEFKFFVSL